MLETVIGGLVVAILTVALFQPRPRALFVRWFPTVRLLLGTPDGTAQEGVPRTDALWEEEIGMFRSAVSEMWVLLVPHFERVGFFGDGAARSGLQDVVIHAAWPDHSGERSDAATLATGALTEFCASVCAKSGERVFPDTREFLAFDTARRQATNLLRVWAGRTDAKRFLDWLRDKDRLDWPRRGPTSPTPYLTYHARTVKLVWYLELAVASESRNECADCSFLPTLRDSLNAPLPMMVTGDDDGYMTLIPPEG